LLAFCLAEKKNGVQIIFDRKGLAAPFGVSLAWRCRWWFKTGARKKKGFEIAGLGAGRAGKVGPRKQVDRGRERDGSKGI